MTLEELTADRTSQLPKFRESLLPLRAHLARFPFLGGSTPNWLDRGFDLYDGIGRDSMMQPLFE